MFSIVVVNHIDFDGMRVIAISPRVSAVVVNNIVPDHGIWL
jgi:hypothetical protein